MPLETSGKAAIVLIGKSGNLPSRRAFEGREEPYEQEIFPIAANFGLPALNGEAVVMTIALRSGAGARRYKCF